MYTFTSVLWCQIVFQSGCSNFYSLQQLTRVPLFSNFGNTWYCQALEFLPIWCLLHNCGFNLYFLLTNDFAYLCTVFGHLYFLFCEIPVPIFSTVFLLNCYTNSNSFVEMISIFWILILFSYTCEKCLHPVLYLTFSLYGVLNKI